MREDSVGLFWEDKPRLKERGRSVRPLAAIPDPGWRAPAYADFPDLRGATCIGIDTETYDPELLTHGPGWARGKGHIVGISVSVESHAWYFPVRHSVCPEQNLDPEAVFAWARANLSSDTPKVGANLLYDVGWLGEEGVNVGGKCYDVQFAEALLSEGETTALEDLGNRYLREGKETSLLYQWCADSYGGKPTGAQRGNIHRAPPCLVGPYAELDALLPQRILAHQWSRLQAEGLLEVFDLETRLIPMLIAMRRAGVSVDLAKADQVREEVSLRIKELGNELRGLTGFEVNPNAPESLKRAFQSLGIPIPTRVTKGVEKQTFAKEFLSAVEHPLVDRVLEIRKLDKLRGTFIDSYIRDSHVNGKVYCQFHPLRGDDGGTRSGRLASSTPNLQNIPSRDEELAPRVRGIFIPDTGHVWWRKYDYSQIEYRFLAHFAVGASADKLRKTYCEDPKTDYHVMTQAMVQEFLKRLIARKPIKNINFGLIFGMGKDKLTRSLGMSKEEGEKLFEAYHAAAPFAKETMEFFSTMAGTRGFIQTISGRRSRFDLWEPDERFGKNKERKPALPYAAAYREYKGKIKRAFPHKALNRLLQGSAADLMKYAMLALWDSGVFAVTGVPRLTVHDELDFSDPGASEEAWRYVKHTMENALRLRIPVIAEEEKGFDWGHTS